MMFSYWCFWQVKAFKSKINNFNDETIQALNCSGPLNTEKVYGASKPEGMSQLAFNVELAKL